MEQQEHSSATKTNVNIHRNEILVPTAIFLNWYRTLHEKKWWVWPGLMARQTFRFMTMLQRLVLK